MTWSVSAQGHHNTSNWEAEEYRILRGLVDAFTRDASTVTSVFSFSGNHVQAGSIEEAREKLASFSDGTSEPAPGAVEEES